MKKKSIATLVLAATITLTGCTNIAQINKESGAVNSLITEQVNEVFYSNFLETKNDVYVLDATDEELLTQTVMIDSSELINEISLMQSVHPLSSVINAEYYIQKYNELNVVKNSSTEELISYVELADIIFENNKNYNFSTESFSYNDITFIAKTIIDTADYIIQNTSNININDVNTILKTLKVNSVSMSDYANVNSDNCMNINLDYISTNNWDYDYETILKHIISHETVHLIQRSYETNLDSDLVSNNYGPFYEFANENINPMYNLSMTEAAAEIISSEYYDIEPIVYSGYIRNLKLMEFATSLDGNSFNAYTTLSPDFNDVRASFNDVLTDEEIVNLLVSIDLISGLDNDFSRAYYKEIGETLDLTTYGENLNGIKNYVASTLTKNFYSDLANNLTTGVTLEEIFENISTFENAIDKMIDVEDQFRICYTSEFLSYYCSIQDNLFDNVSFALGISYEKVLELYKEYKYSSSITKEESSNSNLDEYSTYLNNWNSYTFTTINDCFLNSTYILD